MYSSGEILSIVYLYVLIFFICTYFYLYVLKISTFFSKLEKT